MYDLVGQSFKTNIGTGVFTKGPDGSQVENSVFLTDGICYLMKIHQEPQPSLINWAAAEL